MTLQKLTIIQGGRDEIEADLAKALFGVDDAEIARCLERLNSLQIKRPKPKLVKNKASQSELISSQNLTNFFIVDNKLCNS